MLDCNELVKLVVTTLDDIKAQDTVVLPVTQLTTMTDFMIICTGNSARHVKSMGQRLIQAVKKHQHPSFGMEGEQDSEWVLVDLGDVIVHIMQDHARECYDLERLWSHG